MKNPLQSLVNNHAMIEKIIQGDKINEYHDVLERAITSARKKTKTLTELISSVNEYSSGSENKVKMDLKLKLEDVLIMLGSREKIKILFVLKKQYPDEDIVVQGYNSLLQALVNIVGNAIDAVDKENGEIMIVLSQTEKNVEISVRDNGMGISKDVLPHIFDPFVTTKDPDKGTGLGLFITRSIIEERHAGIIKVESEQGKGTTFRVVIPKFVPDMQQSNKPRRGT
ncbi:MAG: HAMP domain-containing sensor histidine kinase [Bdellovibrionota bacterium]